MRHRLIPAILIAVIFETASPPSAQVQIDTSSPETTMASLAELHESWTHIQFTEFLRAPAIAGLPDKVEDPVWWQENPSQWEFLPDAISMSAGISVYVPLILERDPFIFDLAPAELAAWLQATLRRGVQGRAIEELVSLARQREGTVLRMLQRRRHLPPENLARVDDRLTELERAGPFEPGAVGCSFDQAIDLAAQQAMMADLQILAETCPQQRLIRFLRAAAVLSAVPEHLAHPGARMDSAALQEVESDLQLASLRIGGLAAYLQRDPFLRRVDNVPERLKAMLDVALQGRSLSEVVREGERLERAFLMALRKDVAERLRRAETHERSPERPKSEAQRLRAYIERIDGRLAILGTGPVNPDPPIPQSAD